MSTDRTKEHPIAKGTYLEPWRSAESESYPSWGALWAGPYKWLAEFEREDLAERAAVCVNAMAGIEDPAEFVRISDVRYVAGASPVARLLEAVDNLLRKEVCPGGCDADEWERAIEQLRDARRQAKGLSILQPEEGE